MPSYTHRATYMLDFSALGIAAPPPKPQVSSIILNAAPTTMSLQHPALLCTNCRSRKRKCDKLPRCSLCTWSVILKFPTGARLRPALSLFLPSLIALFVTDPGVSKSMALDHSARYHRFTLRGTIRSSDLDFGCSESFGPTSQILQYQRDFTNSRDLGRI